MERVEALDERTFAVSWKQAYPWADRLGPMQLEPLPDHLVGELYRNGDKDAFNNASFWSSTAYIGSGPYRLVEWTKGSQLRFQAFEQYYLGAPKLDEVIIRVVPDPNTVIAHILGGEIDATVSTTINQQSAQVLREQWAGNGQFYGFVRSVGTIRIQHHPDRVGQPALQDVRVRRALLHGIDRAAVVETVRGGGMVANALLPPDDPLYPRGAPLLPAYPFDPTRAWSLLEQAGWTVQSGALGNAEGQRFKLDIAVNDRGDQVAEMAIYADYLARLGMDVSQTVVSEVQSRDPAVHSGFLGLNPAGLPLELPNDLRRFLSTECPTEARRYEGGNYGCWSNAEYDRLTRIATTSLSERERADATIEAVRIWADELPSLPVAFSSDYIAVRSGLRGAGTRLPAVADTWNIHAWDWTAGS
jgi:peptide/nickel transport system substrate-binding protein